MDEKDSYHDIDTLLLTFLQDGDTIIDEVTRNLSRLEEKGGSSETEELINQLFRDVHSFKSEAAYLEYQELAEMADEMESILHNLREFPDNCTESTISDLFRRLNELAELFNRLKAEQNETGGNTKGENVPAPELNPESSENAPLLDDFEQRLLEESRQRGEDLYRLVCELDPKTQMKYPRVYLLLNNLELIVNVIKTIPSMDQEAIEKTNTFFIYFSSAVGEEKIFNALSIDEIERIQLTRLDYSLFLSNQQGQILEQVTGDSVSGAALVESGIVSVETRKIEELIQFMDEAQYRIAGIEKIMGTENKEIARTAELISKMEDVLRDFRMVRFGTIGMKLMRFVRDMADKKKKRIAFSIIGEELYVDRRILTILSDPFIHLIRNAVDHGIESPVERENAGKNPEGKITLSAWKEGGRFYCSVKDDGRGVDPEELKKKREKNSSYDFKDNESLLRLLASPGFSTREKADTISGRGVGLDLVTRKVRQNLDGDITMKTSPGSGVEFLLSVPEGYTMIPLLVVSTVGMSLAIPKSNCEETLAIDSGNYGRVDSGLLTYNGIPVYTCYGKVAMKGGLPKEPYGCSINHLGKKGILLVDEILFERDITQSSLRLDKEVQPHMFEISAGSAVSKLLYLSPSFIGV